MQSACPFPARPMGGQRSEELALVDLLSRQLVARREPVLYYCQFTWFPGTTREKVAQRVVQQHDAGKNHPERIKGWYNLVGGGAGFLLVDYDDPRELTAFLQPYMDLMGWDVRAVTQNDYAARIEELRQIGEQPGQQRKA